MCFSSISLIYANRIQITTDESELECVISPNLYNEIGNYKYIKYKFNEQLYYKLRK